MADASQFQCNWIRSSSVFRQTDNAYGLLEKYRRLVETPSTGWWISRKKWAANLLTWRQDLQLHSGPWIQEKTLSLGTEECLFIHRCHSGLPNRIAKYKSHRIFGNLCLRLNCWQNTWNSPHWTLHPLPLHMLILSTDEGPIINLILFFMYAILH